MGPYPGGTVGHMDILSDAVTSSWNMPVFGWLGRCCCKTHRVHIFGGDEWFWHLWWCSECMYIYIIYIYIYLILYRNSFLNKTRCINGWGQGISMLHITFTRQQAKCCGGEVLVTSPDASYGLATLTRLAPSTHPKSSRNEALFPFTIIIISPFFISQGCFNSSHDEPVFLQKVGRFPILDTREMMFQRPSEEDQDRIHGMHRFFFLKALAGSFSCTFCKYRDANEQINTKILICIYVYSCVLYIRTYVYVFPQDLTHPLHQT